MDAYVQTPDDLDVVDILQIYTQYTYIICIHKYIDIKTMFQCLYTMVLNRLYYVIDLFIFSDDLITII